MNNNKYKQELIDRYLLGEMDQAEQKAFEEQLEEDRQLREDMELSRHIINAFHQDGEQAAFAAMKSASEEEIRKLIGATQSAAKPKRFSLKIQISVAAAAVIFLLIYIGVQPKYSPEQLFSNYYVTQPYEVYPSRGSSEWTIEEKIELRQARTLYEQKEYGAALAIYEQFLIKKPEWKMLPEEILFYTAICQFEMGDIPSATEKLSYIASSDQFEFQDDALWNLSFVYLKENKREEAKECLQKLITKGSVYAEKARTLEQELRKRMLF